MQILILLSTQFAALNKLLLGATHGHFCSQLRCEDRCLCGTFLISSALVKPSMHLHSIFQIFVKIPVLKMTQFYILLCCASLCFTQFYNPFHGILERKRDYMDDKSHYLSVCTHTSHLEVSIQPPEKQTKQNCVKNYFREFISSDCTSPSCYHISLLQFTAKLFKRIVPVFYLQASLPFCCESTQIRLSSTTIPSYYREIRESLSQ